MADSLHRSGRMSAAPEPRTKSNGPVARTQPASPRKRRDAKAVSTRIALWVIATCAGVYALNFAEPVLLPLVIAAFLFYALDPVVDFLHHRRVPRILASTVVVAALVTGVMGGAYALWPQVDAIIAKVPEGAQRLRSTLRQERRSADDSSIERVQKAAKAIDSAAAEAAGPEPRTPGVMKVEVQRPIRTIDWLWSGGIGAVGLMGQAVTILFLTIFLLNEDDSFKRKIVGRLRTERSRRATVQILDEVDTQMKRFIWVQALTSLMVASATTLALWWMGVEQPIVWGIFAGLLNNIPYYGPIVVTAALAAVSFLQFGTVWQAVLVGGVTLVITSLEGMLLTPYLLTKAASLNPVATFVSLAFWGWLWGVPGIFLAVPLLMTLKSVCDHVEPLHALGDILGE